MRYKNCEERVLAELQEAETMIEEQGKIIDKLSTQLARVVGLVTTIKPYVEVEADKDIKIVAYSRNPYPTLHIPELYNALAELFGITELFAVDPNRAEDGCKDGSCGINYGE